MYEGNIPNEQTSYYSMNEDIQATDKRIVEIDWKVDD